AGGGSGGGGSGGDGASFIVGVSLASRLASFAAGSPKSSEAMRPDGGGLNSGTVGTGCGGGSGGGGSSTSRMGIGSLSGGAAIGHSTSNNRGSKCSTSEPIGPRHRTRSRFSTSGRASGASSGTGSGETRRGALKSVGS